MVNSMTKTETKTLRSGFARVVFKEPERLIGNTEPANDWDKIYATEQLQLLDSLMTLSEERNQETFFESAPQATLQIYMGLVNEGAFTPLRVISIATSILALGLAASDYTEHKLKRHYTRSEPRMLGTFFILAWKLPTLAARCISLAVFCAFIRSSSEAFKSIKTVEESKHSGCKPIPLRRSWEKNRI